MATEISLEEKLRLGMALNSRENETMSNMATSYVAKLRQAERLLAEDIEALHIAFIEASMQTLQQERKQEDAAYDYRVKQAEKVHQETLMERQMTQQAQTAHPTSALQQQIAQGKTLLEQLTDEWADLQKQILQNPLSAKNATPAQIAQRHQQITANWQNQVLAQIGPTVTLSTGTSLNIPQQAATGVPTAAQILMRNPGLAQLVMGLPTPTPTPASTSTSTPSPRPLPYKKKAPKSPEQEQEEMQQAFAKAVSLGQRGAIGVLTLAQKTQEANPDRDLTALEIKELILRLDKNARIINVKAENVNMPEILEANNQLSLEVNKKDLVSIFAPPPAPPPPPSMRR